eukprot:CAMPEP_0201718954 /NCGR_PEP_ID=MMETSP0593-20130828/4331_1 /ASSEMBLY_ACC=CAM_ASM_000672 /TAXON_ID=267983 /ORGANISM="Skeletonema japonicum, Strain CCMP2506" /LENGTH=371 /DNA_ID=CAMNT_0048209341 /DNA_START=36 /DNA_END=1151 /DNA_ORIENTATION=+
MASFFPIGSRVILQNLAKGTQYNGMKGTVKSLPDPTTSRQNIHVHAANKSLAVKPINLRHEPRELTSLSIDEMSSLLLYVEKMDTSEMNTILAIQVTGEMGVANGLLQMLVQQRISECPNDLAQLLAEAKAKEDECTAKRLEARKNGPSCDMEKVHPSDYLKGRYKQNAKKDAKEERKQCCNRCGKTNVKLAKCGRCLSVFYCSKQCQKTDHVTHKKECKNLLKQRVEDVDMAHNGTGGVDIIPRIGVALSESITGVHGEVICHLPCWMIEELAGETRDSFNPKRIARSIRYFFKMYQSSVEAATSLSVDDLGGMCADAIMLYWLKYPGVRRVYSKEANSEKFTLNFGTNMEKPHGWSLGGFEDRFAKLME